MVLYIVLVSLIILHAKQVFEKNKETTENNLVQKAFVLLN